MSAPEAIRVGVAGAAGRMGQLLVRELAATQGLVLAAATEMAGHPALGRDAASVAGLERSGVEITAQVRGLVTEIDVAIDFTAPAHSVALAEQAATTGTRLVVGTTGLDDAQRGTLERAARETAIVWAPNMSVGVRNLIYPRKIVVGGARRFRNAL